MYVYIYMYIHLHVCREGGTDGKCVYLRCAAMRNQCARCNVLKKHVCMHVCIHVCEFVQLETCDMDNAVNSFINSDHTLDSSIHRNPEFPKVLNPETHRIL